MPSPDFSTFIHGVQQGWLLMIQTVSTLTVQLIPAFPTGLPSFPNCSLSAPSLTLVCYRLMFTLWKPAIVEGIRNLISSRFPLYI